MLAAVRVGWQEHWSGLPFPYPGDLPNPGIKPESLASPASSGDYLSLCHWVMVGLGAETLVLMPIPVIFEVSVASSMLANV